MIVELFGPPGVGKTTFATALAGALRKRGGVVESVASYRPAETGSHPTNRHAFDAARRVARPFVETLAIGRHRPAATNEVGTPAGLLRLLPPKNLMWSIRLHQYLLRLYGSWEAAAAAGHVVLFDQAFVQAVCSLALLSRAPDWRLVEVALDAVPKPDVLFLLGAPRAVLEARLTERQRRQSRMERLLELDLPTNLRSVEIVERLHGLLRERGQPVIRVDAAGPEALQTAVSRAEADLCAAWPAPRQMAMP